MYTLLLKEFANMHSATPYIFFYIKFHTNFDKHIHCSYKIIYKNTHTGMERMYLLRIQLFLTFKRKPLKKTKISHNKTLISVMTLLHSLILDNVHAALRLNTPSDASFAFF